MFLVKGEVVLETNDQEQISDLKNAGYEAYVRAEDILTTEVDELEDILGEEQAETEVEVADEEDLVIETDTDTSKMKKAELLEYMQDLGFDVDNSFTVAELRAALAQG